MLEARKASWKSGTWLRSSFSASKTRLRMTRKKENEDEEVNRDEEEA